MQINQKMLDAKARERLILFLRTEDPSNGKLILILSLYAGLSADEISQLKWSDLNLEHSSLSVNGRTVPLPEDLFQTIWCAQHRGNYVIHSKKAKGGPTTRMNVTRAARKELSAAGFTDITLRDLSGLFILSALETFSIEQVSRISGYEIRSLYSLIRENCPERPLPKRADVSSHGDPALLQQALEQEGDSLDTRIVWLCWQGGLTFAEMSGLCWENISFQHQTWEINGISRQLSSQLCKRLQGWEPSTHGAAPVLRGKQSGKRLDAVFLAKRGKEFLIRNGFESIPFYSIRGKYNALSASEITDMILQRAQAKNIVSAAQLGRYIDASADSIRKCLHNLVQFGELRYLETEQRYSLPEFRTNKERIHEIVAEHRQSGTSFTLKEIACKTGLKESLIHYYLQRLETQNKIEKIRAGTYLCV